MVNNLVVSAHSGKPPTGGGDRKISNGPLYSPDEVLQILAKGDEAVRGWTLKCIRDLQNYTLEGESLVELICDTLQSGRYRDSEWCEQSPGGPWAACDAYELGRKEWSDAARKDLYFEYFIKFAISKTGTVILLVSCHL